MVSGNPSASTFCRHAGVSAAATLARATQAATAAARHVRTSMRAAVLAPRTTSEQAAHLRASRPEQAERARVAVQEGRPLHRTDLAVAKEAAERDVAEVAAREVGVVVGPSIEVHAAPEAREQERAGRRPAVAAQQLVEILRRRPRVAQVELDDHAGPDERADGHRARLAVEPQDVPDEEVALAVLLLLLAHHDADEQRRPE